MKNLSQIFYNVSGESGYDSNSKPVIYTGIIYTMSTFVPVYIQNNTTTYIRCNTYMFYKIRPRYNVNLDVDVEVEDTNY
jgi:hypothetical protein